MILHPKSLLSRALILASYLRFSQLFKGLFIVVFCFQGASSSFGDTDDEDELRPPPLTGDVRLLTGLQFEDLYLAVYHGDLFGRRQLTALKKKYPLSWVKKNLRFHRGNIKQSCKKREECRVQLGAIDSYLMKLKAFETEKSNSDSEIALGLMIFHRVISEKYYIRNLKNWKKPCWREGRFSNLCRTQFRELTQSLKLASLFVEGYQPSKKSERELYQKLIRKELVSFIGPERAKRFNQRLKKFGV